jgi:hypothetical protein
MQAKVRFLGKSEKYDEMMRNSEIFPAEVDFRPQMAVF